MQVKSSVRRASGIEVQSALLSGRKICMKREIAVPESKKGYTALLKKVGVEPELATQAAEIRSKGGSRTPQEREVMRELTDRLVKIVKDEINSGES